MRFLSITRVVWLCGLLLATVFPAFGNPPSAKVIELLPNQVGKFHQLPTIRPLVSLDQQGMLRTEVLRSKTEKSELPFVGGEVEYLSAEGEKLTVEIVDFKAESDAYSFLTLVAEKMRAADPNLRTQPAGIGTVSFQSQKTIGFFKGTTFVRITSGNTSSQKLEAAVSLAHLFADRIDKGEGEVPVLLMHLPNWETAAPTALYFVSLAALKEHVTNQAVLDAISFDGGSEAVSAKYGPAQFLIVEFTTPQLALDNDWNIREKIKELSKQGKDVPTVYRRVGNYAVLVFNGPNEQAANQLIDQVKYEQVVQWLGDNPYWLREAQKRYTQTVLGTFVSVMKASGLAAVLCFGIGGFFGALLFARRRAQQASQSVYSDAGGMMRLNIDDLSAETDTARLLGPGKP